MIKKKRNRTLKYANIKPAQNSTFLEIRRHFEVILLKHHPFRICILHNIRAQLMTITLRK